jgi:hypothetical protein
MVVYDPHLVIHGTETVHVDSSDPVFIFPVSLCALLLLLSAVPIHLSLSFAAQLPGLKQLTDDDVWLRRKAPNTLVLHGRVGNCIGEMASYDYFTLGGPYSVRGYSPGELGACRWVQAPGSV